MREVHMYGIESSSTSSDVEHQPDESLRKVRFLSSDFIGPATYEMSEQVTIKIIATPKLKCFRNIALYESYFLSLCKYRQQY